MSIDLNNINKGDGVGAEKTANNANSRVNALAGFGQDYGQQEARLALALADAGLGGGGGGGGATAAEIQTAMINALQSQNQVEFQEIVLQDANNVLFISSRQINEETGSVTVSTRLLDGTSFTPVSPISLPKDLAAINSICNNVKYVALSSSSGVNIGDSLVKYFVSPYTNPGSETFAFWYNETVGRVLVSAPTDFIELDTLARGQKSLRGVSTNTSMINIKTTNALIKDIFVDNLATGVFYIQIFASQTGTAPTTGAVPIESYRVPSNGSLSIEITRVYLGQVYVGFSSTAGTFTASTNSRNYNIRYE